MITREKPTVEEIYNDLASGRLDKHEHFFRAAMIAVRETYNKGINPESVELMYNTLKHFAAWEADEGLQEYAINALKSAKLNENLQPSENFRSDRDR